MGRQSEGVAVRAGELLNQVVGRPAEFRDSQFEAIDAIVSQSRRVLVVQRTGWGKSAVYFIAARLLRDIRGDMTLVVSPLIALMRNQVSMAKRAELRAVTINSSLTREAAESAKRQVLDGEVDVLFVTPETLTSSPFRDHVLQQSRRRIGMVVIDEVHCISEWGHDFRPKYRRLKRVLDNLPEGTPVLGTTATATQRVIDDIVEQMGDPLEVIRGPLGRRSLQLDVLELEQRPQRLAWIAGFVGGQDRAGIVYCLTVRDTEVVAGYLQSEGLDARPYSGELDPEKREQIEDDLLDNQLDAVIATSALGMGFDKPDLGFVVHFQTPGSAITYYQQVGRAGRDLSHAHGVLLRGHEDDDIIEWFISSAFPEREATHAVLDLLNRLDEPATPSYIMRHVNVRPSRLEAMLRILEDEGVVSYIREEGSWGWVRTVKPWAYPEDRVRRVAAQRRREYEAMVAYARAERCLMATLRDLLDDRVEGPCGRCTACRGRPLVDVELDPEAVDRARRYLWDQWEVVRPRKRWPSGLERPRGMIPADLQSEEGRVLGRFGDGTWGDLVIAGRASSRVDSRVTSAVQRLVHRWAPTPTPTWLTVVPSRSHATFMEAIAEELSQKLGLPYHAVLSKSGNSAPQIAMQNSQQKVTNIYGTFTVHSNLPEGPVLLVDDVVDSRWTLTVATAALREAGAGPVYPLALVQTTTGDG